MKKGFLFMVLMLLMGARIAVNAQELTASDVQNSGCMRGTRARANENEQRRTIILTKEGDILSVQLLGFEANCCISGFDVKSNMKDGSETMPCLLSVSVGSYSDEEEDCDCICPYNISFTINGVEVNSFRFSCWWYDGLVSLTEGEPLALEDIKEDVSIDGTIYTLDKVAHTAKLRRKNAGESEVNIPSELSYEGQEYTVNSIGSYVFHSNAALTSVTIPGSITYIGEAAFYGCSNLKDICCQADNVPVTGRWVFDNTPIASATLHVPAGSLDKYKATSPWSEFGNIVALPQETSKPMLKDGRVWNCIEVYMGEEKNDTVNREYRIEGTSEIDGHVCYNLCLGGKQIGSYYEEGPKVFHYTANGWELLFDFSLSPGDAVPNWGGLIVDEVKTNVIKGESRRCLYFPLTSTDGTELCWIEGIGSSLSGPYYDDVAIGSLLSMKLQSVYDGDVCIFESDDFMTKTVEINETTFPDEEFRNWVLRQEYGKDGVLTDEEIAGVTFVNLLAQNMIAKGNIQSLKGIEYFTAMTKLICQRNELTELDLSKNTALTWLECYENNLTELNLSKNTELTYLACECNLLTSLDVSDCTKLEELACYDNQLTTLNISMCSELKSLKCYLNRLTALDVSDCTSLTTMWCSDNQLPALDVSNCTSLSTLWCGNNLLTQLDVSNNLELIELRCQDNLLTNIDLSQNKKINELRTYHNQINGEAMDALIESLPMVNRGGWCCVLNKEERVVTTTQAAAAKAKGWELYYWNEDAIRWQEYEGYIPSEPVTFTKDQMATIILPTEPDASKGKFYRLDRVDDKQIIFEQELQPQARVPYIIVPSEDFCIDPSSLDLEGLTKDSVSIEGVSFIGSYTSKELPALTGGDGGGSLYYDIIDKTPDCSLSPFGETGKGAIIGALRAYLLVHWEDPYHHGGTKVPGEKMEIALKDDPNGIKTLSNSPLKGEDIYDLSGRKMANGKLPSGVYLKSRRKILIK